MLALAYTDGKDEQLAFYPPGRSQKPLHMPNPCPWMLVATKKPEVAAEGMQCGEGGPRKTLPCPGGEVAGEGIEASRLQVWNPPAVATSSCASNGARTSVHGASVRPRSFVSVSSYHQIPSTRSDRAGGAAPATRVMHPPVQDPGGAAAVLQSPLRFRLGSVSKWNRPSYRPPQVTTRHGLRSAAVENEAVGRGAAA
eukprot:scaffold57140_cov27-Tisochrysis_lutea.AAC.3